MTFSSGQGDVVRHCDIAREVPPGLVEQQHGVPAGLTISLISARCRFIAAVLQKGRTRAAPLPSRGQTAPKM